MTAVMLLINMAQIVACVCWISAAVMQVRTLRKSMKEDRERFSHFLAVMATQQHLNVMVRDQLRQLQYAVFGADQTQGDAPPERVN